MTYELIDFFCGAGGSSQGATAVAGVTARLAANHWAKAIESHAANFPDTEHFQGDLHEADVARFPRGDIFWASPECTWWSQARGDQREFDKQPDLFGDTLPPEAADRSRSLMWDVPKYLEAMTLRGRPVLAGVVENVIEARMGAQWHEWVRAIECLGYRTRLIALNSMHARSASTPMAPQSRDRLYLAYWLKSLGRNPDWDKWLRPVTWCPSCEEYVGAVQWWKRPGNDMGRYRSQYLYRCPKVSCRGQLLEPEVLPAAAAIDWSNLGQRIGDRDRPLSHKTIARIEAGLAKYAQPITLEAAGNTFERRPGVRTWPVSQPVTTLTATETKGLACPPMVVPAGGTWNDDATPVTEPIRTRTARETDALAFVPFIAVNRGGEPRVASVEDPLSTVTSIATQHSLVSPPFLTILRGQSKTSRTDEPLTTVSAGGGHHGLVVPPFLTLLRSGRPRNTGVDQPLATVVADGSNHGLCVPPLIMRNNMGGAEMCTPVDEPLRTLTTKGHQSLLVPYYGTGVARPVTEPSGAITTKDRYGLATGLIDVDDVLFRMLEPGEIGAAMAFLPDYLVLGNKREKVRQYGNAVTPPVAEVIISALVEAISGEQAAA